MNDFKANVLLFAAGLGTRLRPATDQYPKPVIPLFGIPLGYYLLPYFKKIAVDKYVVNTFHLPQQVKNCYSKLNLNIQFSNETDFIKGSGGGLKQVEGLIKNTSPIITANADEIIFAENTEFLNSALKKHLDEKALATLIVMNHPEAGNKFGGIWTEPNTSQVIAIGKEKPTATAKAWHFVGLQILSPEIFSLIELNREQNIFYDVLIHHLKNKKIQIYPVKMDWYETGNLADYLDAKKQIAEKKDSAYKNHFIELSKLPKSDLSDLA